MAHYLVEYNGKVATFSTIADGFISPFMEKGNNENEKIVPIDEVMINIVLNRTFDEAKDVLLESGLNEEDSLSLLNKTYDRLYKPILIENDIYECPNCGDKIKIGQKECLNPTCEIEFKW